MEEADRRKIGLDGARRPAAALQVLGVGDEVLGADVCELLQMKLLGEIAAKPLHRLVVAAFGLKAALPVVARQLIELGKECKVDVICRHVYETSELMIVVQAYGHSPPADICRRFRPVSADSAYQREVKPRRYGLPLALCPTCL